MFEKFIFTPVISFIDEAVSSLNVCSQSIAMQPIIKYTLNALYLQVTGTIEQKLFFITWQIATKENDIRYDVFRGDLKAMSTLEAKEKVYRNLIRKIRENTGFSPYTLPSVTLFNSAKKCIDKIITLSPFCSCFSKKISLYQSLSNDISSHMLDFTYTQKDAESYDLLREIKSGCLTDKNENMGRNNKKGKLGETRDGGLLGFKNDLLARIYNDFIYKKRNLIAHNTKKIPELTISEIFSGKEFMFDNIFIQLLVLIYIDKIFIYLYNDYKNHSKCII